MRTNMLGKSLCIYYYIVYFIAVIRLYNSKIYAFIYVDNLIIISTTMLYYVYCTVCFFQIPFLFESAYTTYEFCFLKTTLFFSFIIWNTIYFFSYKKNILPLLGVWHFLKLFVHFYVFENASKLSLKEGPGF